MGHDEFGESWIEAGNFQSYGPFALKEWKHGETITFVRNPFWQGTDTIPVAKIDGLDQPVPGAVGSARQL